MEVEEEGVFKRQLNERGDIILPSFVENLKLQVVIVAGVCVYTKFHREEFTHGLKDHKQLN